MDTEEHHFQASRSPRAFPTLPSWAHPGGVSGQEEKQNTNQEKRERMLMEFLPELFFYLFFKCHKNQFWSKQATELYFCFLIS